MTTRFVNKRTWGHFIGMRSRWRAGGHEVWIREAVRAKHPCVAEPRQRTSDQGRSALVGWVEAIGRTGGRHTGAPLPKSLPKIRQNSFITQVIVY